MVKKRYIETALGLPKLASAELGNVKAIIGVISAFLLALPAFVPAVPDGLKLASPPLGLLILVLMAIHVLIKKNVQLEDDQRPRVEVLFEAGNSLFEHTEPLVCGGLARWRTFCIGIHNPGNKTVHGCTVKLLKKEPPGAYLPIALKLHGEDPVPTRNTALYPDHDFQQEFSVKAQDYEYIDIARYSETKSSQEIELCFATEGKKNGNINRWVKPDMEHRLSIGVFNDIGKRLDLEFKIWVDGDNRFHCDRLA